jgi:hypothetical protein
MAHGVFMAGDPAPCSHCCRWMRLASLVSMPCGLYHLRLSCPSSCWDKPSWLESCYSSDQYCRRSWHQSSIMMAAKDKRLQLASETFLGIRASTAKEDERTTAFWDTWASDQEVVSRWHVCPYLGCHAYDRARGCLPMARSVSVRRDCVHILGLLI